jgi:seryl-tRNA synthetase
VKYSIAEEVTEEQRKNLTEKLVESLTAKLLELDGLYKSESEEAKDNAKKIKEINKLYEENKETLAEEFNRLKSVVSDLHFASTVLESDVRNVFYKYPDIITFVS